MTTPKLKPKSESPQCLAGAEIKCDDGSKRNEMERSRCESIRVRVSDFLPYFQFQFQFRESAFHYNNKTFYIIMLIWWKWVYMNGKNNKRTIVWSERMNGMEWNGYDNMEESIWTCQQQAAGSSVSEGTQTIDSANEWTNEWIKNWNLFIKTFSQSLHITRILYILQMEICQGCIIFHVIWKASFFSNVFAIVIA